MAARMANKNFCFMVDNISKKAKDKPSYRFRVLGIGMMEKV